MATNSGTSRLDAIRLHLNKSHKQYLADCLKVYNKIDSKPQTCELTVLNLTGMTIHYQPAKGGTRGTYRTIPFTEVASDDDDVKNRLEEMLTAAHKSLGKSNIPIGPYRLSYFQLLFAWYHGTLLETVILRGFLVWSIFSLLWLLKLVIIWVLVPLAICFFIWCYKDFLDAVKRWDLQRSYAQIKEFGAFLFQKILLDPLSRIKFCWNLSIRAAPFLLWSPKYIDSRLQGQIILCTLLTNAGLYFLWVRPLLYKHQVSPAHWRSWAGATILCGVPTYLRLIQLIAHHKKLILRIVFS